MKYWDRVRITSWFYEGMEGTAIRFQRTLSSYYNWEPTDKNLYYSVTLWDDNDIHVESFPESNLEIIN